MQGKLFLKAVVLFLLFLLLQAPLIMTHNVVSERSSYRDQAIAEIARAQAGEQRVLGPVLVIPYRRTWTETYQDADGNTATRQLARDEQLSLLPEQLDVDVDASVESRQRGIFSVPVFRNTLVMSGRFAWPEQAGRQLQDNERIEWRQGWLALGVAEQRGIKQVAALEWQTGTGAGQKIAFEPGSQLGSLLDGGGLHAALDVHNSTTNTAAGIAAGHAEFRLKLVLTGTQRFALVPLGEQTTMQARSNWPHPQFNGGQLPDHREISASGFEARWQTSHLATNLGTDWQRCFQQQQCDALWSNDLGISLIDPVDVYTLTDRALKYGFLFIGITFAAFFLFELRMALPVHPVQYGLVGLALGLFFLLLISLAEQTGFGLAYLVAATACIALISYYLSAVLHKPRRAALFAALLAILYGALYSILHLEDVALLIGACLLFVLLAVVMALTRNTDWYQWSAPAIGKPATAGSNPAGSVNS